jgi:uracil-DNA glycosylase
MAEDLDRLLEIIRTCRHCVETTKRSRMMIEPRPVVRVRGSARLLIAGQAPGARVHASGIPFDDPSGDRLRSWMGVTRDEFYDEARIAFAPMGFCFPGYNDKGADLPPRRECAPLWRTELLAHLPNIRLMLLIGRHAQAWHLKASALRTLAETVRRGAQQSPESGQARVFPLPHPSWRNTGWLKANPWFETDVLPRLRHDVRACLDDG